MVGEVVGVGFHNLRPRGVVCLAAAQVAVHVGGYFAALRWGVGGERVVVKEGRLVGEREGERVGCTHVHMHTCTRGHTCRGLSARSVIS